MNALRKMDLLHGDKGLICELTAYSQRLRNDLPGSLELHSQRWRTGKKNHDVLVVVLTDLLFFGQNPHHASKAQF